MKTYTFFILFQLILFPFLATANGVGSSMEAVLKTDFAEFFHIAEQGTEKGFCQQQKKHYKTGGFQEFNDLYFVIDKNNVLVSAKLDIKLEFITKQSTFAIDIIKSFIKDFAHEKDQAITLTLSDRLYNGEGEVHPKLNAIMEVLNNKTKWATVHLSNCIFEMMVTKESILINYYFVNWKELAVDMKLYLQKSDLAAYNLKLDQEEPSFKVWTLEDKQKGAFSRFVDGRWTFKTEEEAANCYQAYQKEQSEGAVIITAFDKKLGDESAVYYYDKSNNSLLEALNLEDKYFYFYFRKGKTIAKIFVVTDEQNTVQNAYKLAQKAEKLLK